MGAMYPGAGTEYPVMGTSHQEYGYKAPQPRYTVYPAHLSSRLERVSKFDLAQENHVTRGLEIKKPRSAAAEQGKAESLKGEIIQTLQVEDLQSKKFRAGVYQGKPQLGRYRWGGTGLRSADRNNKATLLLTRPERTAKSSAKDLSPREVKLQFVS
jgi:hypothetical protein